MRRILPSPRDYVKHPAARCTNARAYSESGEKMQSMLSHSFSIRHTTKMCKEIHHVNTEINFVNGFPIFNGDDTTPCRTLNEIPIILS